MRSIARISLLFLVAAVVFLPETEAQSCREKRLNRKIDRRLENWKCDPANLSNYRKIRIDSFQLSAAEKKLNLYFAPDLSYLPVRENDTRLLYSSLTHAFGRKFRGYQLEVITGKRPVQDFIPNWDRKEYAPDPGRADIFTGTRIPLVTKPHEPRYEKGLYNNNIALWASHGIFYETGLDRWEYQRARLFGTVEDIHPTMYVLPYLVPMLENSGAGVFLPRERDTQTFEVIADNNARDHLQVILPPDMKYTVIQKGFAPADTLFYGDKPFEAGTSLRIDPTLNSGKKVEFIPVFPARGNYAVYVAYVQDPANSTETRYTVYHLGGETSFLVNQRMGGSTWVYLGNFEFGSDKRNGVAIHITGNENGFISADAVRFGGGMGNVARRPADNSRSNYTWKLSGKPRYMEAARYYLQYAGMPDTLVYNLNKGKNDYTDDLQSRGEWVNYLIGASRPQYRSSFNAGLNIPVDLSFAFHTDAGTTPNDSVIGTLCIYSTEKNNGIYPNGQSKMTNRDLADMIQTEIVNDIRREFKPDWTRRAMWDRGYSEAFRQIVPSLLLELLSHQNAADMQYSLDPRFRFTASRAMYKGMLKYLAFQQNRPYVVQPLPVNNFAIYAPGNKQVVLSWKPVTDSAEVTARPSLYKVYRRIADGGFDNGTIVRDTFYRETLESAGTVYSYKVTALNDGGESFPSEILAVGYASDAAPRVLVVNGFDRICAPAFFSDGNRAGIAWWEDQGVPYISNIGHTGNQYDFNRKSDWKDDDSPGWGASYANMEGKIIPGNTFDFTRVHGEAMLANGVSFVSVSDEVFTRPEFEISNFAMVDIILGEEKSTVSFRNKQHKDFQIYTPAFMNKVREVTSRGKGIFISGAYTGTDLLNTGDSTAIKFAREILHFQWRTNHAVTNGNFYATDNAAPVFKGKFSFNTGYNPAIYTVEAPDAIDPEGKGRTIFRYSENNTSAGVAFEGSYRSLVCGFPFETIQCPVQRNEFMLNVLNFLNK